MLALFLELDFVGWVSVFFHLFRCVDGRNFTGVVTIFGWNSKGLAVLLNLVELFGG